MLIWLKPYIRGKGFTNASDNIFKPFTFGGEVIAEIMERHPDGDRIIQAAIATCSMSDAFNYKTGRILATERALDKMLLWIKSFPDAEGFAWAIEQKKRLSQLKRQ
jgi:hypothetical protein